MRRQQLKAEGPRPRSTELKAHPDVMMPRTEMMAPRRKNLEDLVVNSHRMWRPTRMLLTFSEQTKGKEFPNNASDQEMLEIVMSRYEKELINPIQNLLHGELARALLIQVMHVIFTMQLPPFILVVPLQVQKLKLDIEMPMLELDQILRANEINFAILAALPAFALSLGLIIAVRACFRQDTKAEGRGRIARIQRRLIIAEIEKTILQYQTYMDQGLENDAQCLFGLLIYCLDRLYLSVRRHAKSTGEWQRSSNFSQANRDGTIGTLVRLFASFPKTPLDLKHFTCLLQWKLVLGHVFVSMSERVQNDLKHESMRYKEAKET
ncbi:cation/H(+) antiporter 4-like [Hibiscus syriacus]|uniref:Cation/H(+) antiporter 4-like n=1 Tax=Hibiscus syriacus TaxID=106335 RepID=A0A6A3C0Y7_HIBSY|nr:cation/H(+) antiporter 4-like [Hibiscus syriacus]